MKPRREGVVDKWIKLQSVVEDATPPFAVMAAANLVDRNDHDRGFPDGPR